MYFVIKKKQFSCIWDIIERYRFCNNNQHSKIKGLQTRQEPTDLQKIPNDEQIYCCKSISNRNVQGTKRAQITINSYEHESQLRPKIPLLLGFEKIKYMTCCFSFLPFFSYQEHILLPLLAAFKSQGANFFCFYPCSLV